MAVCLYTIQFKLQAADAEPDGLERQGDRLGRGGAHHTDKKNIKFSSYIRKFRVEQLQSHI
jgi:hypothetical protein